jgi:hypothetical protein
VDGSLNSNDSLLINPSIAKALPTMTSIMLQKIHLLVHDDPQVSCSTARK